MISAAAIAAALGPRFRQGDPDIEKQCSRCRRLFGEDESWWPADLEFFSEDRRSTGRLHSWCRSCLHEARRESEKRRDFARIKTS